MNNNHPYILWRRAALWSNSSLGARIIFWGGCFGVAWGAGLFTMSLTNKSTYNIELQSKVEKRKTSEEAVQTDMARAHLQRLLDDIQKGDDQKRNWKPR